MFPSSSSSLPSSFLVHLGHVPLENTQTLWFLSCIEWSVRPSPGALSKYYYFCLRATLFVPLSLPHTQSETPRLVLWNYLNLRNTSEWTKTYFYHQNLCARMSVSIQKMPSQTASCFRIWYVTCTYIMYMKSKWKIDFQNACSWSYCAWFISPCYSIYIFLPLKWLSFIADVI